MRISAAEFVRQFGRWCDDALAQPVIITRNGRDRLIVMSVVMYRKLINPPDPANQALPKNVVPVASAKPDSRKQSRSGRNRYRKR
jgi:hypothetical protein